MSRTHPHLAEGQDHQVRHPEMSCWDSTADDRKPKTTSRIVDFFVACILGIAMSLMEEPSRKPKPPAYPWRELGVGLGVMFAAIAAFHLFASFWPMAMQVALK